MENDFFKQYLDCRLEEFGPVYDKLKNFADLSQKIGDKLWVDCVKTMRSATQSFINQLEEYLRILNDVENHNNMDSANSILVADENII